MKQLLINISLILFNTCLNDFCCDFYWLKETVLFFGTLKPVINRTVPFSILIPCTNILPAGEGSRRLFYTFSVGNIQNKHATFGVATKQTTLIVGQRNNICASFVALKGIACCLRTIVLPYTSRIRDRGRGRNAVNLIWGRANKISGINEWNGNYGKHKERD